MDDGQIAERRSRPRAGAPLRNETLDAIDQFEPQFRAAMSGEASFGPAKSLVGAMLADGVELTDNDAVQAWIGLYNAGTPVDGAENS